MESEKSLTFVVASIGRYDASPFERVAYMPFPNYTDRGEHVLLEDDRGNQMLGTVKSVERGVEVGGERYRFIMDAIGCKEYTDLSTRVVSILSEYPTKGWENFEP